MKVKGDKPTEESWVEIEKKQVVSYSLKIGEYVVTYNKKNKSTETTKNGEIAQKPFVPKYFAFGPPTTSSTTNFTTLGKNVFAALGSDDSHGVCINDEGLFCLKTNEYETTKERLKAYFGESSCYVNGSYVYCYSAGFNCYADSYGKVDCHDNSTGEYCNASAGGSFDCS